MDTICCRGVVEGRDDTSGDGCSTSQDDDKILECDYDSNECTKLYKLIEGKRWEEITYFLETGKWYFDTTFFTSIIFGKGPDPRFVESRTWVTALDEMGSVRWCQLPLHAAITFQAPFSVITKLVEVYPESIRCADDQDMLPLHYAFRFGSEDCVLSYLLEEFPQAIKKKALRDRLPLDMAQYSSKPERGVIIECFVEMSVMDAKAEWDGDNKKLLSSMKTKANATLAEEVVTEREKLRRIENELFLAQKEIHQLETRLESVKPKEDTKNLSVSDGRTGPLSTRTQIHSGRNSRVKNDELLSKDYLREKKDGQFVDPVEDNAAIEKKPKGLSKMFGRQKKQMVS